MITFFIQISLMLVGNVIFLCGPSFALAHTHPKIGLHLDYFKLAGRDPPSPTTTLGLVGTATPCLGENCVGAYPPSTNLPCTDINGTSIVAGTGNDTWTILCDTDFFAQDIYPFHLTNTFEECLQQCEDYNEEHGHIACAGFVFAPDRVHLENDCYLKSSLNDVVCPSTIHLIAATLVPQPLTPATSSSATLLSTTTSDSTPVATDEVVAPVIASIIALGASSNKPTKQYVQHAPALPQKLAINLLQPGINTDLITKYSLAHDTGSWKADKMVLAPQLSNMTVTPRLSRDGGKGGIVNGTRVFLFCDTSTYGETESAIGYMNGLVSSSAAVDLGRKAVNNEALALQDPVGQWQDDVGRLRGLIELTVGEEAFNIAQSGNGYRYAVWPESGPIPLNSTHSLLYASLVYLEVNMTSQLASFTSLGNTLASMSTDFIYGPYTDRLVNQMFTQSEVQYGSLGGLRAWGSDGIGKMDGSVYLFGKVNNGVVAARVEPHSITDRSLYEYWNGHTWTSQTQNMASLAYLINQPVLDFDIFYSPYHNYYIMVYLTPYADNTFWFRYSLAPSVPPPYKPNSTGDERFYQYILNPNVWSVPYVLWRPDPPPKYGYVYAGGVHKGYFGVDDITEGGNYLLITWTEHTDVDPNDPSSGYAHKAARIHIY